MSLHGKKRRIVVSSSDEDDEGPAAAPPKQRKRRSEPATAAEILRAAEACKRDVLAAFPEYKPALRGVAIEVSSRMQTSGAKTMTKPAEASGGPTIGTMMNTHIDLEGADH